MCLGCFAAGRGTAHFLAVKLLTGWPHPNCLPGAVADLCQLTGWTWELFHIKMVILDQNLCQGLCQLPGWVVEFWSLLKAFPGADISCYCRQNSDSSAVKCRCCFCSEFSLSHISRFSTTVGFICLSPNQELSYLKSVWRLSCLRNKLWAL